MQFSLISWLFSSVSLFYVSNSSTSLYVRRGEMKEQAERIDEDGRIANTTK
jgi:hypothetical protein